MGSCTYRSNDSGRPIRLITLDPGHFHAALVQKTMYEQIDPVVHVYAPAGSDLELHLDRINAYNDRQINPTHWKEDVYRGNDFFEKMIEEKKGNVVVLSGNNRKKADYILKCVQNGFHVFADKPMAIDTAGFSLLKKAFDRANINGLVLYDIMTERHEITSVLQREISMIPNIFGTLQKGTASDPAVVKQSIHYFYKYVSGHVLTRPAWFFDATQQGEAITDVMTHLVDLVQWECFPGQAVNYRTDISVDSARHWPVQLGLHQFKTLTGTDTFPSYLKGNVTSDTLLTIPYNGEISYRIKGIYTKTTALWDYQAPEGSGDNYYSMMKGTRATLLIRQGVAENYQPTLYIQPADRQMDLSEAFKKIQLKYPGVQLAPTPDGWRVVVPQKYKEGHEEHFAKVTGAFLDYIQNRSMPAWEVPNMLAKYFVTTQALEIASKNKK